jgi:tRNA nucleotidyltransferase (CCA-adding enzyme)
MFAQAKDMLDGQVLLWMRWALFTYRLDEQELEDVIAFLRPDKKLATVLRDTNRMKTELKSLARADRSRSYVYSLLNGRDYAALLTHLIANDSLGVRSAIDLYLEKLRFVRPALTGADLLRMGVPAGPQIQEALALLRNARLDGIINSRVEEERAIKQWHRKGRASSQQS